MIEKVRNTIQKYNMFQNTNCLIVGVSGGADSVCLLDVLNRINSSNKFKIIVVHVHHGIRGWEADNDAEFVKNLSHRLNLTFHLEKIDVKKLAKTMGCGIEECGRKLRYEIFFKYANRYNAKVATAHTLSDSMETIIMNMVRGTGISGLCGIPPIRQNIIRPLIDVSREEIEFYCKKNSLKFVNDSTNFETLYTRNKLRLKVIPMLKKINPSFNDSFKRMLQSLYIDNQYLSKVTDFEFKRCKNTDSYCCEYINNLDESIKMRVIMKICKTMCQKEIGFEHIHSIAKIIKNNFGAITLPGDIILKVENNFLTLQKKNSKFEKNIWEYPVKVKNVLNEIKNIFIIKTFPIEEVASDVNFDNALDTQKIPMDSVFRNRRGGDIFCPKGRNLTKKLKKLFNELKIPLSARDNIPLIASKNDVLWIDGIGVSDKFRVDYNTKFVSLIFKENFNNV